MLLRAFLIALLIAAPTTWATDNLQESQTTTLKNWPHDVPAVLNDSDVRVYKKAFNLQRRLRRSQVVRLLPRLSNNELMGHLVAVRLLHPLTRASYSDLQGWLAEYNDQAPAHEIYELANKRKPKGQWHKKPAVKNLSVARYSGPEGGSKTPAKVQKTKERASILRRLRYYRVKERFDNAQKLLLEPNTKRLLGEDAFEQVGLKLAQSMMNSGKFTMAGDLAVKINAHLPRESYGALWVSGFAAYRAGDVKQAASELRKLAYAVPHNSKYYARAAWWAAKAYEEMGRGPMSRVFLNMAAQDPYTFYGLLANAKLERVQYTKWRQPELNPLMLEKLMQDQGVRRVIALAQIGEYGLAQLELKASYERLPYDADETLLALSNRLHLAGTSVSLGRNLMERKKIFLPGLYPVINAWLPEGLLKTEPALLHAITRQESAFDPNISSRAGARGLMQLMPATARYIRQQNKARPYPRYRLFEPAVNVKLGQDYLAYLGEKLNNNLLLMIAAYNAGPGNVNKWTESSIISSDHPVLYIESIPFGETRNYVMKVLANYWMYQLRMGQKTKTLEAMANHEWPQIMLR